MLSERTPRRAEGGLKWLQRIRFRKTKVPSSRCGPEKIPLSTPLFWTLLNEEPADLEIPAQDEAPSVEPPLVSVTELHPTAAVWSGTDDRIARFLTAAMQENEIPIHLETAGDLTTFLVSAANEARAREIVREVTEGAPPE